MRRISSEIKRLTVMDDAELATAAKEHQSTRLNSSHDVR